MMNIKDLKTLIQYILYSAGILSNIFGLINGIVHHTGKVSIICTLISLYFVIVLFLISFFIKNKDFLLKAVVIITGFIEFPIIFMNTRLPQTFIIYFFLIPTSYSLSISKKTDFLLPAANCIVLSAFIYTRLSVNYVIIFSVIYMYILFVSGLFSISIYNYSKDILKESFSYKRISEHDELTRLYNRHYLQSLENQSDEYIPIMIDIDFFKRVNDTYGHKEGDRVLQLLASILLRYQSDKFIMIRYGGEEFLILSKLSDEQTDKKIIDIFNCVRRELCTIDHKYKTISVGIGSRGVINDTAIKIADINLYLCKNHGRNCIAKNNEIIYS